MNLKDRKHSDWLIELDKITKPRLRIDVAAIIEWDYIDKITANTPGEHAAKKAISILSYASFSGAKHASSSEDLHHALIAIGYTEKATIKKLKPKSTHNSNKKTKKKDTSFGPLRRKDCHRKLSKTQA